MRRAVGWVKRADRAPVHLDASIQLSDGKRLPVVITDLSLDGCKVRSRDTLRIGETVELAIGARDIFRASVRWSMAGQAGLQYI